MSYSNRETIYIIDELIRLTQHDLLKWTTHDPDRRMNDSIHNVDATYVAEFQGNLIRVYRKHYKSYFEDTSSYHWDSTAEIELIDPYDRVLFKFPFTPNKSELLNAIEAQNSSVRNFFNHFNKKF